MGKLDGRVAIVTGGGRGIGASIARAFAKEGAAVVVNDLGGSTDGVGSDAGPAHEVVEEIKAGGGQAVGNGGDVSEVSTGEELLSTAVKEFGKLDILVNVAGILRDRMIFNMSPEDWDAVIKVHLRGTYSTIRPASAYWREKRNPEGNYRIINFVSESGLWGNPGQPNYGAAKMGIVGLTYSVAQGLARYGVTANAIGPRALTRLNASAPAAAAAKERPAELDPFSPDNVAPMCVYLGSEQSSWLSGRVFSVGGYNVELYNNPEVVASVTSEGPWSFDDLASQVEGSFKPLADGLPITPISAQIARLASK
jgi:NAD(P)-dependent dehydrogenase (short-subunit alcohol dehydrogenase family)